MFKRIVRESPDEWRNRTTTPADTSKFQKQQEQEFLDAQENWDRENANIGGLAQLSDKYIDEGCDEDGAYRQACEDRAGRPNRKDWFRRK